MNTIFVIYCVISVLISVFSLSTLEKIFSEPLATFLALIIMIFWPVIILIIYIAMVIEEIRDNKSKKYVQNYFGKLLQ